MGLKNDIEEARSLWNSATLLTKILLVITVFLSASSITSLSDKIFEWKGFILDGVKFYREWLVVPISSAAKHFNIHWSNSEMDYLIIMGIFNASLTRLLVITQNISNQKTTIYQLFRVVFLPFATLAMAAFILSGQNYFYSLILFIFIISPFIATARMLEGKQRVAFFSPLIAALLIILIFGAVNVGLSNSI